MKTPNYEIVDENDQRILIRDLGPWDQYPTITNNAEAVVGELASRLGTRELHYIDSEGDTDRLLVENGRFTGFQVLPNRRSRVMAERREMANSINEIAGETKP